MNSRITSNRKLQSYQVNMVRKKQRILCPHGQQLNGQFGQRKR